MIDAALPSSELLPESNRLLLRRLAEFLPKTSLRVDEYSLGLSGRLAALHRGLREHFAAADQDAGLRALALEVPSLGQAIRARERALAKLAGLVSSVLSCRSWSDLLVVIRAISPVLQSLWAAMKVESSLVDALQGESATVETQSGFFRRLG